MTVSQKTQVKNEHKQPIKIISHQDIYALYDMLEQLNSWNSTLELLHQFFNDKNRPVNKRKIASEYYACSQLFKAFHQEFSQTIPRMENQVIKLRNKEKI